MAELSTFEMPRVRRVVVETRLEGDPTRIARLGCRFTAPMFPGDPATVAATDLRQLAGGRRALTFTARRDDGAPILDEGFVEIPAR